MPPASSTELVPAVGDGGIPEAATIGAPELADRASALLLAAQSANTVRSYRAGWASFVQFCTTYGHEQLPALPTTLIAYGTWLIERPAPRSRRSLGAPSPAA